LRLGQLMLFNLWWGIFSILIFKFYQLSIVAACVDG
jgi:hypothetical protein